MADDSTTVYTSYYALDCPATKIAREDFHTSGADFDYHQYNFFGGNGTFATNQASLSSIAVAGMGADTETAGFILGAVGGWKDVGSHYGVAVYQHGSTTDHTTQKTEVIYNPDLAWESVSNGARIPSVGQTDDDDFTITAFKVPDQGFADWFVSTFGSPRTATKPTAATIGNFVHAPTSSSTAITFKMHRHTVYPGTLGAMNASVDFSVYANSVQVWPQVPGATYTFYADPVNESFKLFQRPDVAKGEVWPIHAWIQDNGGNHIAEIYYNLFGNGSFIWGGTTYATFAWNLTGPDQLALELP